MGTEFVYCNWDPFFFFYLGRYCTLKHEVTDRYLKTTNLNVPVTFDETK